MKQIIVASMCALFASASFALNLSVQKMRSINDKVPKGEARSPYMRRSRDFHQIRLSGATEDDAKCTWTIRVLPILKKRSYGKNFPYLEGVVEQKGIKCVPGKDYLCVYVSPLLWFEKTEYNTFASSIGEDNWLDILNSDIVVELMREGDEGAKPVQLWRKCQFPNAHMANQFDCIEDFKLLSEYDVLKYPGSLKEKIMEKEPGRIELMSWTKLRGKIR